MSAAQSQAKRARLASPCGGFVEINVGGKIHSILASLAPKDSLLETMLSERWEEGCARDGDGRIFLDRDGDIFGRIVWYLRLAMASWTRARDELNSLDDDTLRLLRIEGEYFGMMDLVSEIDLVRPGLVEVPVILKSSEWAKISPLRVPHSRGGWRLRWTEHRGNPAILRPLPASAIGEYITYRAEDPNLMSVGQTGTYVLFLRIHAAVPSDSKGDNVKNYVEVKISRHDAAVNRAPYCTSLEGETLVRCGAFDSRRGEIMRYATVTCSEVVSLVKGDLLWISHPHEESLRPEMWPEPSNLPARLLNALTLVKLDGNSVVRYDRAMIAERRSAYWTNPPNDLPPTPFEPKLSKKRDAIMAPRDGSYLMLCCTSFGMSKSWKEREYDVEAKDSSLALQICSKGYRLKHRLSMLDEYDDDEELSLYLSAQKYAHFNDVLFMKAGFTVSIEACGALVIGVAKKDSDLCTQHLAVIALSPSQQQNRFQVMNNCDENEIQWVETISPHEPMQRSFFEKGSDNLSDLVMTESEGTFLVIGSFPQLNEHTELALTVNGSPVAVSKVPEMMDEQHFTSHYFHEILQLEKNDRISISTFHPREDSEYWQERSLIVGTSVQRIPVLSGMRGYITFVKLEN